MAFATSFGWLVVGRIIVGLAVGFSSMTSPMYIAEVSPPALRGALVSCNALFIAGGQFSASIIDGLFSKNLSGWRWMLGIGAIPSLMQFFAFLFLPGIYFVHDIHLWEFLVFDVIHVNHRKSELAIDERSTE